MTTEPVSDEIESAAADRLIFFSDAVVAIAMTLLALELPVPSGHTVTEFWRSVRSNSGEYIAFLISFVVISLHWRAHHRVFRYLARGDERLRSLNMLWLLTIVLMPFATNMLSADNGTSDRTHALRFSFYALLQVMADLAFLAMVHRIVTQGLGRTGTPPLLGRDSDRRAYGLIWGFGASIPLFFLTPYAWLVWIAGPLITHWVTKRFGDTRRRARPA